MVKRETSDEIISSSKMKQEVDVKMECDSEAKDSRTSPLPQMKEENVEERSGHDSGNSEGSTDEPEKTMNLNQNLGFLNGILGQNVMSARGSFAMFHDQTGQE